MARDTNGDEIYPGDIVACTVGYYSHIHAGDEIKVDRVNRTSIESDKLNRKYRLDGRFTSSNFIIRVRERKGQTNMTCIAVRIDNSNPAEHLSAHIERIYTRTNADNVLIPHIHASESYGELKEWIEQRIQENTSELWMIFQPSHIAESSSPPVRFKSI